MIGTYEEDLTELLTKGGNVKQGLCYDKAKGNVSKTMNSEFDKFIFGKIKRITNIIQIYYIVCKKSFAPKAKVQEIL